MAVGLDHSDYGEDDGWEVDENQVRGPVGRLCRGPGKSDKVLDEGGGQGDEGVDLRNLLPGTK